MATLNPYLSFNGKCREAMNFYKDCLGGEIEFIVAGESPMASQMPASFHDQILHSSLKTNGLELMATDMQATSYQAGNDVHLCLICKSEEEIKSLFDKLSVGGKVDQPVHEMFFGLIGVLTDKFGKHWMLEFDKN